MKRIAVIWIAVAGAMLGGPCAPRTRIPTKPVRVIVPYASGGNVDIQARYVAKRLSDALGKQFVVDNRPGANGMIGAEVAAHWADDDMTKAFVSRDIVFRLAGGATDLAYRRGQAAFRVVFLPEFDKCEA